MKFYRKISCLSLALISWFFFSSVAVAEYSVTPHPFLNSEQHALLDEMLETQLNYFLSSDIITKSGLPWEATRKVIEAVLIIPTLQSGVTPFWVGSSLPNGRGFRNRKPWQ